ncbi:hypothetical protein LZ32DRAFT_213935 [Colletotrichum eremochloae]|nr:hypothetical protein LZ32DRAFT_213935 [Colletotrichum eremochloae]
MTRTGRNGCSIRRVAVWQSVLCSKAARASSDNCEVIRGPERRPGLGVHAQHSCWIGECRTGRLTDWDGRGDRGSLRLSTNVGVFRRHGFALLVS